jgi:hypothetical protein
MTPKDASVAARKCLGSNAKGEPCGAPPLLSSDWCLAHDPSVPDEKRFGSAAQAARAGASPKPRALKFREALIAKVEEEAEQLVERWLEAANATKTQFTGQGDDILAEQVPDYAARLKALVDLWDRAVGKPGQEIELSGPGGGPIQTEDTIEIADPEVRALAHELLKRRAGDGS